MECEVWYVRQNIRSHKLCQYSPFFKAALPCGQRDTHEFVQVSWWNRWFGNHVALFSRHADTQTHNLQTVRCVCISDISPHEWPFEVIKSWLPYWRLYNWPLQRALQNEGFQTVQLMHTSRPHDSLLGDGIDMAWWWRRRTLVWSATAFNPLKLSLSLKGLGHRDVAFSALRRLI